MRRRCRCFIFWVAMMTMICCPEVLVAAGDNTLPPDLKPMLEHAAIVARGQPIRPEHLPAAPAAPTTYEGQNDLGQIQDRITRWSLTEARATGPEPPDQVLYERFLGLVEPPLLRAIIDQCRGNRAAAAERLGIHRATLRQKLRKYGIG